MAYWVSYICSPSPIRPRPYWVSFLISDIIKTDLFFDRTPSTSWDPWAEANLNSGYHTTTNEPGHQGRPSSYADENNRSEQLNNSIITTITNLFRESMHWKENKALVRTKSGSIFPCAIPGIYWIWMAIS